MKPSSTVVLCNIPELSLDYSNTWLFDSKNQQYEYFWSKRTNVFNNYTYLRKENAIQVGINIDDIHSSTYLFYKNKDGKYFYCFIVDKEYINEKVTKIYITTDIIQTYQFDFTLKPSYVERMHVPRWTSSGMPTNEIEPEGLEYGDNIELGNGIRMIKRHNNAYIVVTSSPLGTNPFRPATGQGGGDDCGNWEEGIISSQGFRFVKGFEAFASKPYWDSIGKVNTIGYGITDLYDREDYNKLYNNGKGCTEEQASRVTYDVLINKFGKRIVDSVKKLGCNKQYQFDALCSLAFNSGEASVTGDNRLTRVIKQDPNNESAIRPIWIDFKTNGGETGLINRRKGECDVFFGKYPDPPRKIITIKPDGSYGDYLKDNNGNGWLPCEGGGGDPTGKTFIAQGKKWLYPIQNGQGTVTSLFGARKHPITGEIGKHHNGVDIGANKGVPVYATRSGVVRTALELTTSYGYHIVIEHTDIKMSTLYAHNSKLLVKVGDRVKAGQKIAEVGTTGNSTGNHLHYELRLSPYGYNDAVNPIPHVKIGDVM